MMPFNLCFCLKHLVSASSSSVTRSIAGKEFLTAIIVPAEISDQPGICTVGIGGIHIKMFTEAVGTYTCLNRHGEVRIDSLWNHFVNDGRLETKLRAKNLQETSD